MLGRPDARWPPADLAQFLRPLHDGCCCPRARRAAPREPDTRTRPCAHVAATAPSSSLSAHTQPVASRAERQGLRPGVNGATSPIFFARLVAGVGPVTPACERCSPSCLTPSVLRARSLCVARAAYSACNPRQGPSGSARASEGGGGCGTFSTQGMRLTRQPWTLRPTTHGSRSCRCTADGSADARQMHGGGHAGDARRRIMKSASAPSADHAGWQTHEPFADACSCSSATARPSQRQRNDYRDAAPCA